MPCSFQWDPNIDQTFDCDVDWSLSGSAEGFSRAPNKSFIMDSSAGKTLVLKPEPVAGSTTTWSGTNEIAAAIDVKHGTFFYDASAGGVDALNLGLLEADDPTTRIIVQNNGKLRIDGDPSFTIWAASNISIALAHEAIFEVNGGKFLWDTPSANTNLNIDISQSAQLSAVSASSILTLGIVNVNSTPKTGYSLKLVGTDPPSPPNEGNDPMSIWLSEVNFGGASTGLIAGASILLERSRITARDAAVCNVQTDFFRFDWRLFPPQNSQFNLGPGRAKFVFDVYTKGVLPFNFRDGYYHPKIFNFTTSPDVLNNSEFVIRLSDAFIGNELVSKSLFAIDGELLTDSSRLKTQGELRDGNYYMTFSLKYGR
jgi:hypothetical protein